MNSPFRRQRAINRRVLEQAEATIAAIDDLRTWLHNTDASLNELREWSHDLADRVEKLGERLAPAEAFVAASRAAPDARAIGLEYFDVSMGGTVLGYRGGGVRVDPDADYVSFEDTFRLSEATIRERQRPYLDIVQGRRPVLDAGCGRGEFLELLREAGVPATGVDLDAGMVARARLKGLDVTHGDAITYLEKVSEKSIGVVFSAQVVEHLPYDHLRRFIRLCWEKLVPGGLLIAETVNPHAPGALKNFWLDLTHQHPVFPEVLLTLCRSIGFEPAYVFHPGGEGDFHRDRERIGDYALVAERRREA